MIDEPHLPNSFIIYLEAYDDLSKVLWRMIIFLG